MKEQFAMEGILIKTNAFNQNIKPLLKQKSLTRALFFHPIISHILFPEENSKLKELRFTNSTPPSKYKNEDNRNQLFKDFQSKIDKDYNQNNYLKVFKITNELLSSNLYTNDQKVFAFKKMSSKISRLNTSYRNLTAEEKELSEIKNVWTQIINVKK